MKESDFEDIICKYPDLIEEGLSLKGRQVHVGGKYVDLLFEDRHGQSLVVELKKGVIRRPHMAQLMDYEGHFLSPDDPTVRVMLVGNRVPPSLRRALDHHGFEWREITISSLIGFLKDKNDETFLKYFSEEDRKSKPTKRKSRIKPKSTPFNSDAKTAPLQKPSPFKDRFQATFDKCDERIRGLFLDLLERTTPLCTGHYSTNKPDYRLKNKYVFCEFVLRPQKKCIMINLRSDYLNLSSKLIILKEINMATSDRPGKKWIEFTIDDNANYLQEAVRLFKEVAEYNDQVS